MRSQFFAAGKTVIAGPSQVCALMPGGGAFAEEVVVREGMVVRLPGEGPIDLEAAAGQAGGVSRWQK